MNKVSRRTAVDMLSGRSMEERCQRTNVRYQVHTLALLIVPDTYSSVVTLTVVYAVGTTLNLLNIAERAILSQGAQLKRDVSAS